MQKASRPKDYDSTIRMYLKFDSSKHLRHELRLHHPRHLMVILGPLPQERVDLIDEDDTRLALPRQAKKSRHKLIRLPIPLVCEHGCCNVDKRCAGFFGKGLGEHCFAAARRAVQEDAFWSTDEGGRGEEIWVEEWVNDGFTEGSYDRFQTADI